MATILSYAERGKQPIRELTVSAAKYRSCIEKERNGMNLSKISAFMAVRVEAQYLRNRNNKRWRDSLKPILSLIGGAPGDGKLSCPVWSGGKA